MFNMISHFQCKFLIIYQVNRCEENAKKIYFNIDNNQAKHLDKELNQILIFIYIIRHFH